jgi:hypothetical protein
MVHTCDTCWGLDSDTAVACKQAQESGAAGGIGRGVQKGEREMSVGELISIMLVSDCPFCKEIARLYNDNNSSIIEFCFRVARCASTYS